MPPLTVCSGAVFVADLRQHWGLAPEHLSSWAGRVVAAGSAVLHSALRTYECKHGQRMAAAPAWEPSDLDLYAACRDVPRVVATLTALGYVRSGRATDDLVHYGGFMRRNGIRSVSTFVRAGTGRPVQVMAVRHSRTLLEVVSRFDLDVCSFAFAFGVLSDAATAVPDAAAPRAPQLLLCTLPEDEEDDTWLVRTLLGHATLRRSYYDLYYNANLILADRVAKYESRGFVVHLPDLDVLREARLAAQRQRRELARSASRPYVSAQAAHRTALSQWALLQDALAQADLADLAAAPAANTEASLAPAPAADTKPVTEASLAPAPAANTAAALAPAPAANTDATDGSATASAGAGAGVMASRVTRQRRKLLRAAAVRLGCEEGYDSLDDASTAAHFARHVPASPETVEAFLCGGAEACSPSPAL